MNQINSKLDKLYYCSICKYPKDQNKTYMNPKCNHVYCIECVYENHIEDSDTMKCLVYNCFRDLDVDKLDNYFAEQGINNLN